MRHHAALLVFSTVLGAVAAQQTAKISIGIRETGFNGNLTTTIGGNGGFGGGIEWINLDGQTLVLDGSWQTFTFNLATDPITGFAGTSANSILEGTYGTFENIRLLNDNGIIEPITLLIDHVVDTTTTLGPVVVEDFELWQQDDEVMFQEPGFSGSTSANLFPGGTSGVDNTTASPTPGVYRSTFQFIDGSTNRWVRLTSFNTMNRPNPVVQLDDNSVITIRMAGFTECSADLGSQGPGTAIASLCGTGLNVGEAMTFSAAGAPANVFGAVGVSFSGFPDLPLFNGNLVSGTGLVFPISLFTDANGYSSLTLPGNALVVDFTLQGAFLDLSQPLGITFTNAVEAKFGQ